MKREGAVRVEVHERAAERRRRRETPVTQPIAPVSMADIAEAFRKAMGESR